MSHEQKEEKKQQEAKIFASTKLVSQPSDFQACWKMDRTGSGVRLKIKWTETERHTLRWLLSPQFYWYELATLILPFSRTDHADLFEKVKDWAGDNDWTLDTELYDNFDSEWYATFQGFPIEIDVSEWINHPSMKRSMCWNYQWPTRFRGIATMNFEFKEDTRRICFQINQIGPRQENLFDYRFSVPQLNRLHFQKPVEEKING